MGSESAIADGMAPKAASCALTQMQAEQDHDEIVHQACRKLNRLMLPFALLFSIIASLDRANLSFASVCMSKELGFTAMDYGLGSAIFFVSYSLFQIPSNVVFIYLGGPLMLGAIAIAWGLVAASMAAVSNTSSFLAVRFLLGIAEAGTVPGIWAYLSSMYPAAHLTMPTTFYMAGITLAQALGAPLAAGLLTMHGAAQLSGWRWLFIIEGIPAVAMGIAIWLFLPAKVSKCKLLTPLEQQHLQAAIDGTIPPTAPAPATPQTPKPAILASDLSSRGSSSSGSDAGSSKAEPAAKAAKAAKAAAAMTNHEQMVAEGMRLSRVDGAPDLKQLAADIAGASQCRVVWCSSIWRFLYLLTLNGLIFWIPMIVQALLDVPAVGTTSIHGEGASGEEPPSDTRILLLAAVPYIAGVATHVVNGMHSHRIHERRYHIAFPWLVGGVLLLLLPIAWLHDADSVSYVLLVMASMGIMGCDGIDVSWIISLMDGLSPSQSVLALAMINMFGNFGGFVGNYVIGALKQATGNYYGAVWMMGSIMVLAAGLVIVFPQSWAMQRDAPDSDGGKTDRASASGKDADAEDVAARDK